MQSTIQLLVNVTVTHDENECNAKEISVAALRHLQYSLNDDNTAYKVLEVGEVIVPVNETSAIVISTHPTAYVYDSKL
jgi:hypothetical protein